MGKKTYPYMGIFRIGLLIGAIAAMVYFMNRHDEKTDEEGYIGKETLHLSDGKMTPEALLALGRISDPQLSPDGKTVLYGITYTSVRENRTCRNLFTCNVDGSGRTQLTFSGKSISNARWSNDGKKIIFLKEGQIWTADYVAGKGGTSLKNMEKISDIPAGISEFKLSPDQSKVMYVSTVKGSVDTPSDEYRDLDKADAYMADDLMYRHWDHWVTAIPHTFVSDFSFGGTIDESTSVDILSGESGKYELPSEPFSGIEQLAWSPDGSMIAYSCRKLEGKKYAFSTNSEIYIYDVMYGRSEKITDGGGYDSEPVWSPDGKYLCWISMERDGYEADKQRLMLAELGYGIPTADEDMSDDRINLPVVKSMTDLTMNFKYNAAGPVWSSDSKTIYFNALAEGLQGIFAASPFANHRSGSQDSDEVIPCIRRITGENDWYDFSSPFAVIGKDDETRLLTSWCSMDFPTELVSVTMTDGKAGYEPITDENSDILSSISKNETQARYIETVDGKQMLTWVLLPPGFDPSKKYPAILICLGGPQGTLSQGWSYRWNYKLMANQGYIVILPNRRGTTAFGQEWTEQISGDYCGLNIQDYLSAARELKSEKYVGKMAACGASYGGYSVYYLCGNHENTFDAFIAHAGIFNEEHMYMTTEEMWFPNWDNGGLHECEIDPETGVADRGPVGPKGDGETFGGIRQGGSPWSSNPVAVRHYENSPHKFVTRWHTPLMVIHGGKDFRVPVDQGMAAYNAAQMMGVPSRLLIFPDENHWILKPQNALLWHREYFKWLDRWLKQN